MGNLREQLESISPLEGRYKSFVECLSPYFSEFAFFKYRIKIEIDYFIYLHKLKIEQLPELDKATIISLKTLYSNFNLFDCFKIKEKEEITKHDVKAIEYYLQEKFNNNTLTEVKNRISFIHFGLTSQDINCPAQMLMIRDSISNIIIPTFTSIVSILNTLGNKWHSIPMLSHTHGQPASPTTVGKELLVFEYRLRAEILLLLNNSYTTKFGGAVGNMNAHYVAYPNLNWEEIADNFIRSLGLKRNKYTTQISNYEEISYILDILKRINCILIDANCDIWFYISKGYFRQQISNNEVGSSTMPHKINPINFENSEGNLIIANSLLEGISRKIPISRLQRDLTDSTILRNVGSAFGYSLIAYKSFLMGLNKLELDKENIQNDLFNNLAVIGEAIQTILRREGINNAYEMVKDLTRKNKIITSEDFFVFIERLKVNDNIKEELRNLTLSNYIGNANIIQFT
jgi:adenylosuccinate lyase